jgi:hypothetical protein
MRPVIVAAVRTQNGDELLMLCGLWRVHEPPDLLAQRHQLAR